VILVAVAIVISAIAIPLSLRLEPSGPPLVRDIQPLGAGEMTLDVPLMTLYTAPAIANETVESEVGWSRSSTRDTGSTMYRFDWEAVSASLPVLFGLAAGTSNAGRGSFEPGNVANAFVYYPMGPCRDDCTLTGESTRISPAGVQMVYYQQWKLNYTVSRVTDIRGLTRTSFLHVEFSLVRWQGIGDSIPVANVTAPGPSNVSSLGFYHLSPGSWMSLSTSGMTPPLPEFRHNGTTASFDAGAEGTIRAQLVSRFEWSSADDYTLTFSSTAETWTEWLFDLRFGSLLIRYVEAPF
jgi:hypothetical protein